jgi:hypothetical protein
MSHSEEMSEAVRAVNGPPGSQPPDNSSLRPLLHQLARYWWVELLLGPPCQALLGTAVPPARDMVLLIPSPFTVWGADELRKWVIRARSSRRAPAVTPAPAA